MIEEQNYVVLEALYVLQSLFYTPFSCSVARNAV